jgi:agmatinase
MILFANSSVFLGIPPEYSDLATAPAIVVPFPYEGGVSYGLGTATAPQAVLEASRQVELYDEVLDAELYVKGIGTLDTPPISDDPQQMDTLIHDITDELYKRSKFPVILGGDHSITSGAVRAAAEHHSRLGVIQLDAHADLRESYENNPYSHACVMARVLEITSDILQIGIRSMSAEEARRVKRDDLTMVTMAKWRKGDFDFQAALKGLPHKVYLTIDVDVFDWSVIASTGTPEPGGLLWDEMIQLLSTIFSQKEVVACDVVELAYRESDLNSPFAVAKLIYKLIGLKFAAGTAH